MSIDPWHIFTGHFGQAPLPCTTLVTLLDLVMYLAVTVQVSRARAKYKVAAPNTDGPDNFMRVFRVQMNTLEQMALHLPLLWISAVVMDDVFAALLGTIWLFGRILYARGYYAKAKRRAKGFIISMLVNIALLIAALVSTLASF